MKQMQVYLNFDGNTEEAFNFYKSVFGTEFDNEMRMKDVPGMSDKLTDAEKDKIMNIALPIGNNAILMGTDALDSLGQKLVKGNNMYIVLNTESKEEADKLFTALSNGGKVESPMKDEFWGDYFGSFTDKFGVQWMIVFGHSPQNQP